jgi:hypothetical protein
MVTEVGFWQQMSDLISKVGFPICVASWYMMRTDKRLERLARLLEAHMLSHGEKGVSDKGIGDE